MQSYPTNILMFVIFHFSGQEIPEYYLRCLCLDGAYSASCTCGYRDALPAGPSWWENVREHAYMNGQMMPESWYSLCLDRYEAKFGRIAYNIMYHSQASILEEDCPEDLAQELREWFDPSLKAPLPEPRVCTCPKPDKEHIAGCPDEVWD